MIISLPVCAKRSSTRESRLLGETIARRDVLILTGPGAFHIRRSEIPPLDDSTTIPHPGRGTFGMMRTGFPIGRERAQAAVSVSHDRREVCCACGDVHDELAQLHRPLFVHRGGHAHHGGIPHRRHPVRVGWCLIHDRIYAFLSIDGWLGNSYNRKVLLAGGVGLWSLATVGMGFSTDYSHRCSFCLLYWGLERRATASLCRRSCPTCFR